MNKKINNKTWFATQVDRDFETNMYGNGTRLYIEPNIDKYKIITGYSFDGNILKVKDEDNNIIELNNEPDNIKFTTTLFGEWRLWNNNEGKTIGEDRKDYEPWAYNSLIALATELGVYEPNKDENVKMFYKH